MARRGLTGQLNMFDLFNSMQEPGEVEMVSLVPEYEDEPESVVESVVEPEPVIEPVVEPEPVVEELQLNETTQILKSDESVVMSRSYKKDGKKIEIAYLNYNKVRVQIGADEPEIKTFTTSKEAVDYYVEVMQEYEIDE